MLRNIKKDFRENDALRYLRKNISKHKQLKEQLWRSPGLLTFVFYFCDKIPRQKQIKRERAYFDAWLQVPAHHCGEVTAAGSG